MKPPSRRCQGFTLLEVLLALALLALVISLVQGAYSGVTRSSRISGELVERTHAGTFLVHRLADELAMMFVDPNRMQATGLRLHADSDGLASLSFTSRVPPVSGFSLGGDAEIGYLVEVLEDGSWALVRREADDLDGDLESGGEPYRMLHGISLFAILCYDGNEWLEEWDSELREPGQKPLPDAVTITVTWTDAGDDRESDPVEYVFRTTTPVYASF